MWADKHPLAIRWFHWINFPVLAVMVWSGLLIYWANDVYQIRLGSFTLFKFFPETFYSNLNIGFRLAEGMAWHFTFMWLFAVNGLLYIAYLLWSGEWRYVVPFRNSPKFHPAQQFAYTVVILMGAASLVTGLAIYKPSQLAWLTSLLGGYQAARLEHFVLTIGFVLFFAIHVTQVIRAGWNNFRSMITGYE
jgi:thiosulfate reductase cytochrome b subunit